MPAAQPASRPPSLFQHILLKTLSPHLLQRVPLSETLSNCPFSRPLGHQIQFAHNHRGKETWVQKIFLQKIPPVKILLQGTKSQMPKCVKPLINFLPPLPPDPTPQGTGTLMTASMRMLKSLFLARPLLGPLPRALSVILMHSASRTDLHHSVIPLQTSSPLCPPPPL